MDVHRGRVAVLLLCLTLPLGAASPVFGPREMLQIATFSGDGQPVLSPRGDRLAFAITDRNDERNILAVHPTAALSVVSLRGETPHPVLGSGEYGDMPAWSPDGSKLALFRTRDARRQLVIWDVASGTAKEFGDSFEPDRSLWSSNGLRPRWTSDGTRVVVATLQSAPIENSKPRVTVIKSTDTELPGDSVFVDRRAWRIGVVDVATSRFRYLMDQSYALRHFSCSPDGQYVLFDAVTPETLGHFRAEKTEFWIVPLNAETRPRVVLQGHHPEWVVFSGNGQDLLYAEAGKLHRSSLKAADDEVLLSDFPKATRSATVSHTGQLAVLAARPGTGPPDRAMYSILRPTEDVLVMDPAKRHIQKLTDPSRDDQLDDLNWTADGDKLLYRGIDTHTFRETLYAWTTGGDGATPIYAADETLGDISSSKDGSIIAFTSSSAVRPTDAFVLETPGGTPHAVTHLNPQLADYTFVAPEIVQYYSADGEPLRGLLFRPPQTATNHAVPVITYVYEKLTPTKNSFNQEAQMYITHGYAYLMPDVLVKPGYTGESFVKSVVPAVNAVRALGFTDSKFGITGGSFGGFAGLYLISHVDIFAAAVLRAPPSEFFSTWGDGRDRDVWTIETGQARTGGSPWQVPRLYVANSPFFSADRVHTPVLIFHGQKDYTVPTQQGEMMFYALRYLKRPAELVLYRDADHSIVRGSRDDYLDYYERTLNWWARYLKQESENRAIQ